MDHLKYLGLVSKLLAAFALLAFAAMPAKAQENSPQNTIGAIGNLFGALAQAGAKANAERAWAKVNPQITQCANTMLSGKNVTVDQLIAAGLGPNDQRIAPIINACNAVLTAQLRTNFPCSVTNSKGQQVTTTCNESFAKEVDGSLVALSIDDVILAAGNGEKITAANFETVEAQQVRLAEEQRQAQAERQAFLASPEGKRQVAAEAARARQAELARKQAAAARAAELAKKPRGYEVVCGSDGDAQSYNLFRANCGSKQGVMNGFRWAYSKLLAEGSYMAEPCLEAMGQYADIPLQVSTSSEIIYGLLAACNIGLREINGPSLKSLSGKRR